MSESEHITPPKWPLRLLRFFVRKEYLEEIEGDMEEVFQETLEKHSEKKAKWLYACEVFKLLKPALVRNLEGADRLNQFGLLNNYFTVVRRTLWRNKGFATINILGLTISISVALLVFLTANHEYSYDQFHKDSNRIYRVVSEFHFAGEKFYNPGIAPAIPDAMETDITGLEIVAPIYEFFPTVKVPSSNVGYVVDSKGAIYANGDFFKIFSYKWLAGSPEIALSEPYGLVLTKSRCDQYFNSNEYSELIGKTLVYNDSISVTLRGVVGDLEGNSDLVYQEFVSRATIKAAGLEEKFQLNEFNNTTNTSQLYIKTFGNSTPDNIKKQLSGFLEKYLSPEDNPPTLHLQPLSDIHFSSNYYSSGRTASKKTLYGLIGLAAFLLALGSINYINLSTAQSAMRSKEVGIRKSLGSSDRQLVWLTMFESIFLVVFATIVALLVMPILIKSLSSFLPEDLTPESIYHPIVLLFALVVVVVVGGLSGLFPGLILSRLRPILAMKSNVRIGQSKISSRHVLTIAQFMISQFLVGITVVMVSQINYSINKDPGFNKDAVITIRQPYEIEKRKPSIIETRLKSLPQIENFSIGSNPPLDNSISTSTFIFEGDNKRIETHIYRKYGDHNYTNVYQLDLLAGRNIGKKGIGNEVLINETYAKILGFQSHFDAIGEFVNDGDSDYRIVGVISDFHMSSTHSKIKPLALMNRPESHYMVHIKLSGLSKTTESIRAIEEVWNEVYPEEEFSYSFIDDKIAVFYESERQISRLLKWVTGMAIFISCLGLLGLAVFTVNHRAKEIGIRKVLGITIPDLVLLLGRDSLKLVFIAIVLAIPISWIAAQRWLQGYAYGIELRAWMFVLPGLQLVVIAFITIASQSIKAALLNPIESLKNE